MRQRLFGAAIAVSAVVLFTPVTAGATASHDLTGTHVIAYTCTTGCSGVWVHTMEITEMDVETGDFTGTGHYNADPGYTWDVTGVVEDASVTYTIVYTGKNAGYWVESAGSIDADGAMGGNAWNDYQQFEWETMDSDVESDPEDPCSGHARWDLTGTYQIAYDCLGGCSGVWVHTMNITEMDFETGDFRGDGHYDADPGYTWDVAGKLTGSSIEYRIVYTGTNAGYWVESSGEIDENGVMGGNAWNDYQLFVWEASTGAATQVDGDGDGVLDSDDACPDTPGCEIVDGAGCAVQQYCPCESDWRVHAGYVLCVTVTAHTFAQEGLISGEELEEIALDAWQSDCGRACPLP